MESNESPEIPDRGKTSDIPGLPSRVANKHITKKIIIVIHYCTITCMYIRMFPDLTTVVNNVAAVQTNVGTEAPLSIVTKSNPKAHVCD